MDVMLGGSGDKVHLTLYVKKSICESFLKIFVFDFDLSLLQAAIFGDYGHSPHRHNAISTFF